MAFFETLRQTLAPDRVPAREVAKSPSLNDTTLETEIATDASLYDKSIWLKKLKRILDELPTSKPEYAPLIDDAHARGLDPAWLDKCQRDEFLLLIRRAVCDGIFTEQEHRKLDMARDLIGITNDEAITALNDTVVEAEAFFGKPIEKG